MPAAAGRACATNAAASTLSLGESPPRISGLVPHLPRSHCAGGRRAKPSTRARTPPSAVIAHKCATRFGPGRARRAPLFQRPESFFRRPGPRLAAVATTARRHVLSAALATRAYLDQGRVGLGRPAWAVRVGAHARANQSAEARRVFSGDPEATFGPGTGSNARASPIRWGRPTRPLPHARTTRLTTPRRAPSFHLIVPRLNFAALQTRGKAALPERVPASNAWPPCD